MAGMGVIRVDLTVRRSIPVFSDKPTFSDSVCTFQSDHGPLRDAPFGAPGRNGAGESAPRFRANWNISVPYATVNSLCELAHIAPEAFIVRWPRAQDHSRHWRTGDGSAA
jgi:hypothetical protein